MYTAYPDDPSEVTVDQQHETGNDGFSNPEESILSSVAIHNKMIQFANRDAGDLFAYTSIREPVQYLNRNHQPAKRKGGRPPRDFDLTEDFCDFCFLVQQGNLAEALPLYYYLIHFSGG